MKVYLVIDYGDGNAYYVIQIFSSRNLAEKYCTISEKNSYTVEEFEVLEELDDI